MSIETVTLNPTTLQPDPNGVQFYKETVGPNVMLYPVTEPPAPSLNDVKQAKLAEVNSVYNQALTAGFTSSASGIALVYGYSATDQAKFMQDALDVLLEPTTAFPVTVHPKDGSTVTLDQTQYTQLVADIKAFFKPLDAQQHNFITQVNACTTIDQVNAITIQF